MSRAYASGHTGRVESSPPASSFSERFPLSRDGESAWGFFLLMLKLLDESAPVD